MIQHLNSKVSVIVVTDGPVSDYPVARVIQAEPVYRAEEKCFRLSDLPVRVEPGKGSALHYTIEADTPENRAKYGLTPTPR